jgi:hypothetical protein
VVFVPVLYHHSHSALSDLGQIRPRPLLLLF